MKAKHISNKVKKVDDKANKNASDILVFENRLRQKEDVVNEGETENSFRRGFYYYLQQSYLVYECKRYSFRTDKSNRLITWRSSGIHNFTANSDLKAIPNAQGLLPILENNGRMNLELTVIILNKLK